MAGSQGRHGILVPTFVISGLAGAAAVSLVAGVPDAAKLPGVALGSSAILVLERVLVAFAGWLGLLTVIAEAIRGRLPVEVSGRGVRYASAESTAEAAREVDIALLRHEIDMRRIERQLERLSHRLERHEQG